jgi:hypothetical protein
MTEVGGFAGLLGKGERRPDLLSLSVVCFLISNVLVARTRKLVGMEGGNSARVVAL